MAKITSYRDLFVWQEGMRLLDLIYDLTEKFPKQQQFILTSQMQRAALSIPSNIAEGHGRNTRKDYRQFCIMARGSLFELETQCYAARKRNYISSAELADLIERTNSIGSKLGALIRSLGENP